MGFASLGDMILGQFATLAEGWRQIADFRQREEPAGRRLILCSYIRRVVSKPVYLAGWKNLLLGFQGRQIGSRRQAQ